MKYEIEMVWENLEAPVMYICEDGIRIAMLYEDPILANPLDPDNIDNWIPGPSVQKIVALLNMGQECLT